MTAAHSSTSHNVTPCVQGLSLFAGKNAKVWLEAAPVLSVRRAEDNQQTAVGASLALARRDASWAGLPTATSMRNTTLWLRDGAEQPFATCEHVLSALAGLGMWQVCVVLGDGPECPIADGSALAFVQLARKSGLRAAAPEPLVVRDRVSVHEGNASIEALPLALGERASMGYTIDYGESAPWLSGTAVWDMSAQSYEQEIAPARTFSLLAEARAAQKAGLFTHLTPADMLVLDENGRAIENELRFVDEPVRHKLLDLIGDLALVGRPIAARVRAQRSGHALAAKFAAALVEHAQGQ